jgi:hypothetical protein
VGAIAYLWIEKSLPIGEGGFTLMDILAAADPDEAEGCAGRHWLKRSRLSNRR